MLLCRLVVLILVILVSSVGGLFMAFHVSQDIVCNIKSESRVCNVTDIIVPGKSSKTPRRPFFYWCSLGISPFFHRLTGSNRYIDVG